MNGVGALFDLPNHHHKHHIIKSNNNTNVDTDLDHDDDAEIRSSDFTEPFVSASHASRRFYLSLVKQKNGQNRNPSHANNIDDNDDNDDNDNDGSTDGKSDVLTLPTFLMAWLREPVARCYSMYYFFHVHRQHKPDLAEVRREYLRHNCRNYMFKRLRTDYDNPQPMLQRYVHYNCC